MIFTIKTADEIAGIDISAALLKAGITHRILSKQDDGINQTAEASQQLNAVDAKRPCPFKHWQLRDWAGYNFCHNCGADLRATD